MAALGDRILPLYYGGPDAWGAVMRSTIAFTASHFNTQRMLDEYVSLTYRDRVRDSLTAGEAERIRS